MLTLDHCHAQPLQQPLLRRGLQQQQQLLFEEHLSKHKPASSHFETACTLNWRLYRLKYVTLLSGVVPYSVGAICLRNALIGFRYTRWLCDQLFGLHLHTEHLIDASWSVPHSLCAVIFTQSTSDSQPHSSTSRMMQAVHSSQQSNVFSSVTVRMF